MLKRFNPNHPTEFIGYEDDDEAVKQTINALGLKDAWTNCQQKTIAAGYAPCMTWSDPLTGRMYVFREFIVPGDSGLACLSCPVSAHETTRRMFFSVAKEFLGECGPLIELYEQFKVRPPSN